MIDSLPNRSSGSPFRKSIDASTNKKKHHSLKIVTTDISSNVSPNTSSSMRQRLSSLFRSSTPVVATLKETFSHSSHNLNTKRQSVAEQPTLIEPLQYNRSSTTLSSSSDTSSDHMPASPADANTFNQHLMDPSFWNPSKSSTLAYNAPPAPPPHQLPSLACQVQMILAHTLDEIDEEIDLDWEKSRNVLHQSLITSERITL
jgi:hypothetical protein